MRILIINAPYQTFTCNLGVGHHAPLGLLMVGGALVDAGHEVRLLEAEVQRLSMQAIVDDVGRFAPDVVMTGHSGSTPAHPTCVEMLSAIKEASPEVLTVYGGVYPTFHAAEILKRESAVDFVVRGEGEATATELVAALEQGKGDLSGVPGIAFRQHGRVTITPEQPPIENLDDFRVGWELIEDWQCYPCMNLGRAAVIEFSRGCPHQCTYCGQRVFWRKWRHRDPVTVADDIEMLHRERDVRFLHLADDNPTSDPRAWRDFLEELVSRDLPVHMHATIRASDIVRDADILPLYRRAGVLYVLMGIEATDPQVLERIKKGSTATEDQLACRLLRENGMFSVAGYLVGLGDETWQSFRDALAQLCEYDPDWLNVMYVLPHSWTPFGEEAKKRGIVEPDQSKWDYRHQVLAHSRMTQWQLFLAAKWLELRFHMRPGRLWRTFFNEDPFARGQLMWALRHTSPIWWAELFEGLRRFALGARTGR